MSVFLISDLRPLALAPSALRPPISGSTHRFVWQCRMYFEIISDIESIEILAIAGNIRDIMRLRRQYGPGRWRKLKGIADVRLESGRVCRAELHWYEAYGIGLETWQKIRKNRLLSSASRTKTVMIWKPGRSMRACQTQRRKLTATLGLLMNLGRTTFIRQPILSRSLFPMLR